MTKKPDIKNSKLPFVFSNFAITADGKIAFANGEFIPFGSERDREHMMELRATADAVMIGARTVEASAAVISPGGKKYQRLRLRRGLAEYNVRIIVTGNGSVDPNAEIFKHRFSPIIVLACGRIPGNRLRQLQGVADEVKVFGVNGLDFQAAFRWLRDKWNVKRLLCEGGGGLHGSMVRAGAVDELHLTICPIVFGGRTAPTIAEGRNIVKLADAAQFRVQSTKRVGDEVFVVLKAHKNR